MRDSALGLQILDEELQFRFRFALYAEGAGDVALGHPRRRSLAVRRGRAANEGDQVLARRERDGSRLHDAVSGACRAPTYFLILQGFHFLRGRKNRAPWPKVSSMVQGNKPGRSAPPGATAQAAAFSILSSVNSFIGASSLRSTMRASGRDLIQFPTAE